MWAIEETGRYGRDYARIEKRGYDLDALASLIIELAAGKSLAERHCDHPLKGKFRGKRECHVANDWLLIYERDPKAGILWLCGTGTHAELLKR
jgi:mRNA interferase YafQ